MRGYLVKELLAVLVYRELPNGDWANLMLKIILYKNILILFNLSLNFNINKKNCLLKNYMFKNKFNSCIINIKLVGHFHAIPWYLFKHFLFWHHYRHLEYNQVQMVNFLKFITTHNWKYTGRVKSIFWPPYFFIVLWQ